MNGLKDSRDLCFGGGVAYIAERGNACIRFEDLDGKVRLNPWVGLFESQLTLTGLNVN